MTGLDIEEMERQNLVGKYLKKVSKERHNQYKSNWKFWRNTPSLLRVCRDNNWVIDSIDEELIVKKCMKLWILTGFIKFLIW